MTRLFVADCGRSLLTRHADRGKERYRRAGITATAALISQGLAIIISLASVPLTAAYLGKERYGVWLTISSLLTWMAMTDFGLAGPALVSLIGDANGRDDRGLAREYVASAFWCLVVVTSLIGLIAGVAFAHIPWRAVFRVSEAISTNELKLTCALAVASFVLTLPLNMLQSIYSGYQDGFIANIWAIISNSLSLLSLIVVTRFRGGLPLLILVVFGSRLLVSSVNGVYVYCWQYPWLFPRPSAIRLNRVKHLLVLGSKYMVSQISSLGIYQSQPMIITQILGPAQVPLFVISQKIVTLASSLVYTATSPLIPAYSEAAARSDWTWIHTTLKKALFISLMIGLPLTAAAGFAARPLMRLWIGGGSVPSPFLVLWLSIYTLTSIAVFSPGNVLVALGRMGILAVSVTLCALATVGLSIEFAHWWGISGIAFAMSISTVVFMGGSQFYTAYRLLSEGRRQRAHIEPLKEVVPC
jgi:O-antigen/teichoic acid export membrane protein